MERCSAHADPVSPLTGCAIDFGATSASMLRKYSPGHAWAARRDLLDRVGFYDAMILGSGDFTMAMAAIGRYRNIVGARRGSSASSRLNARGPDELGVGYVERPCLALGQREAGSA